MIPGCFGLIGLLWVCFGSSSLEVFLGQQLWQIQVDHIAPNQGAFKDGLIHTARKALAHHPDRPKVHDIKTLIAQAQVKILNGAPPQTASEGSHDPDRVDIWEWRPVLYVAGAGPLEGLKVIKLAIEEKVRANLLHTMPTFTLVWALGPGEQPPQVAIPQPWAVIETPELRHHPRPYSSLVSPFSVLPPLGRRHVLAALQVTTQCRASFNIEYELLFFGGTSPFRKSMESMKVPLRKMTLPGTFNTDYVRILFNIQGTEENKARIKRVLEEALYGAPVLLANNLDDKEDPFALWLLQQPSIWRRRPLVEFAEEQAEQSSLEAAP